MSNLFGGDCTSIAILGQKGGIGKSTTAANLADLLTYAGKKVLGIDADPQGDFTKHIWATMPIDIASKDPMQISPTLNELLTEASIGLEEVMYTNKDGLKIIPANPRLDDTDSSITAPQVRGLLMPIMQELVPQFDYIIIDTRRSGSRLTKSVIRIADQVIMPMQAEYLSMENIDPTISDVEEMRKLNPRIAILGILPTMVQRTRVSKSVKGEVFDAVVKAETRLGVEGGIYSKRILPIEIERSTRHSEASGARLPLRLYIEAVSSGWKEERRQKEEAHLTGYIQLTEMIIAGKESAVDGRS